MKKIANSKDCTDAVSAVIAVMLMLVVTIIIAAVVSAFAGGLASEQKKTPTASIDVYTDNMGTGWKSKIEFVVRAVSEPIPTKDLKIVTSWKARDGTTGGATVLPWSADTTLNTHHRYKTGASYPYYNYQSPLGYGPKINWSQSMRDVRPEQNFGNFTLEPGVGMTAYTFSYYGGYGARGTTGEIHPFEYVDDSRDWDSATDMDQTIAVLGKGWNHLREGDIIHVKFIHLPSGGTIFEKDVVVVST